MKLEFFPAAEQELLEAAKEYEALFSGLGSDFLLEVERLTSVLAELPSLGEARFDSSPGSAPAVSIRAHLSPRRRRHSYRRGGTSKTQPPLLEASYPRSLTSCSSRRAKRARVSKGMERS